MADWRLCEEWIKELDANLTKKILCLLLNRYRILFAHSSLVTLVCGLPLFYVGGSRRFVLYLSHNLG